MTDGNAFLATLPDMATRNAARIKMSSTPWGPAQTVEQLTLPQRAGEKRFASVVQLLETDNGERLVRPDPSLLVAGGPTLSACDRGFASLTANGGRDSRRTKSSSATRFGSASRNNC